MATRTDESYEIESVSKALAVLETFEEGPLRRSAIERKTRFSRDTVMRTLRTLRLRGWAVENSRGEWTFGPRLIRLADVARL